MEAQNKTGSVPRFTLGQLEAQGILSIGRGKVISKRDLQENPGDYPVYSSSVSGNGEIGRWGSYMFDDERITWSIDGGGKLFYRSGIRYSVTNVGGWIKVHSSRLLTKYLYYVLINQWEKMTFDYVRKAHPGVIREAYTVPLPPVEEQEKIVGMLDPFTELIETLEAEQQARKKQYGYYRDQLMNGKGLETELSAVCQIVDCPHTSPKWQPDGVPVIRNYNLVDGRIDRRNLSYVSEEEYRLRIKRVVPEADDVLFSREAPIGNVGIIEKDFRCCQGQRVVLLRPDREKILPRYLLQLMQTGPVRRQIIRAEQSGSTVSNFNLSDLKKLRFSVPDLDEQKKTMEILEHFDGLCGQEGIPAEIEARQKQYRYYREKILTF